MRIYGAKRGLENLKKKSYKVTFYQLTEGHKLRAMLLVCVLFHYLKKNPLLMPKMRGRRDIKKRLKRANFDVGDNLKLILVVGIK